MGKKSQRRKAQAAKRNRDPNKLIKKQKKREERIARNLLLLRELHTIEKKDKKSTLYPPSSYEYV